MYQKVKCVTNFSVCQKDAIPNLKSAIINQKSEIPNLQLYLPFYLLV
jgi:hypothetical protein